MFIKNTKNTTYFQVNPLKTALPQSLRASRLLFLEEFDYAFNALLSSGQKGVLLAPSLAFGQKAHDRVPLASPLLSAGLGHHHLHEARRGRTWFRSTSNNGQNLIEYAIVIALVSAAVIAMSTYVYRSAQATQKVIEEEYRNE